MHSFNSLITGRNFNKLTNGVKQGLQGEMRSIYLGTHELIHIIQGPLTKRVPKSRFSFKFQALMSSCVLRSQVYMIKQQPPYHY